MEEERESRDRSDSDEAAKASGFVSASSYAGLGVQFALAILVFVYAGRWLDARLHKSPLFVVIGVFVGATIGFYVMYRALMANSGDASRRR